MGGGVCSNDKGMGRWGKEKPTVWLELNNFTLHNTVGTVKSIQRISIEILKSPLRSTNYPHIRKLYWIPQYAVSKNKMHDTVTGI